MSFYGKIIKDTPLAIQTIKGWLLGRKISNSTENKTSYELYWQDGNTNPSVLNIEVPHDRVSNIKIFVDPTDNTTKLIGKKIALNDGGIEEETEINTEIMITQNNLAPEIIDALNTAWNIDASYDENAKTLSISSSQTGSLIPPRAEEVPV